MRSAGRRLARTHLALALAVTPPGVLAAADATPVAPGTVVRWPGEGIEACGRAGERWAPLAGDCWFAVDLLEPAGEVEVERWRGAVRETARLAVGDYPYPEQRLTIADDSKVHLSDADSQRAAAEAARIALLWKRRGPARFSLPLGAPLTDLPAEGRFGARRVLNGEPRSPHSGADYAAPAGTPVLAVADGEVALAEEHFFAGNSVFIDHGDGLISMYFHLSSIAVEAGQAVRRGEVVGAVGATGRATGPHLHFGLRWRGARIDPGLLLETASAPRIAAP